MVQDARERYEEAQRALQSSATLHSALTTLQGARQSLDQLRLLFHRGPSDVSAFVQAYRQAGMDVQALGVSSSTQGEREWLGRTRAAREIDGECRALQDEVKQGLSDACDSLLDVRAQEHDGWDITCKKEALGESFASCALFISCLAMHSQR